MTQGMENEYRSSPWHTAPGSWDSFHFWNPGHSYSYFLWRHHSTQVEEMEPSVAEVLHQVTFPTGHLILPRNSAPVGLPWPSATPGQTQVQLSRPQHLYKLVPRASCFLFIFLTCPGRCDWKPGAWASATQPCAASPEVRGGFQEHGHHNSLECFPCLCQS